MPAVTPYQALPNRFRRAVCGGETQIGCWSSLEESMGLCAWATGASSSMAAAVRLKVACVRLRRRRLDRARAARTLMGATGLRH